MTEARHEPKIHPGKRPGAVFGPLQFDAADPGNPARLEWQRAGLVEPDMEIVRDYRLARLRAELARRDFAGAVLTDPINIRYATDAANMQVWCLHNAVRYVYVATEGPVVLWDFHGCGHVSGHLTRISERRPAISWFWFEAGPTEGDNARRWAAEIADLVRATGGGNMRIGIDKCESRGLAALAAEGVTVHQSQDFAEDARRIKHPEEIKAMRRAVFTAEIGIAEMWRGLRPGLTENQLWSILHQANIARGGEWIETRLLSSGPRTNPWFAECSDRVIEAGDIVAFDTDLIGPYGYCADISRSFVCGVERPSNSQAELIALAEEQLAFNMGLFRPGMSFRELSEASYRLPEDCRANRYSVVAHGVGLCDEYPAVRYPEDFATSGYDGVFEPGMCVCFESYVGRRGGREGVKLERQCLVTDTGLEILDRFPTGLVPEI